MPIDPTQDAAQTSEGELTQARQMAQRLQMLQAEYAAMETALSRKAEEIRSLETEELPGFMEEIGLMEFTLMNGSKVSIKDIIRASLPTANQIEKEKDGDKKAALETRLAAGLKWLRSHKAEDLIKDLVMVNAGKGHGKAIKALMALAKKLQLPATQEETVHWQTLSGYVREQLEKGRNIPFEIFAVYVGKQAQITTPKGKGALTK